MVPAARILLWQEAMLIVLGLMLAALPGTIANREHKVHNIVLYPDKQSWCTTRNITQVITEPGCKQVTIDNNVCVGACFSYSIPHTEPSDPGEIIGPYCDSCQPSEVSYRAVKMDCSEHPTMKTPYLEKHIQLIHNCSCTACEEQSAATGVSSHRQEQSLPLATSVSHHQQQQQHHHQKVRPPGQSQDGGGRPQGMDAATGSAGSGSDMIQDDIPEILEVVHYSENDTEPIRHTPVHELQTHTGGTSYLQQQQLNHYEHNSHTDNVKKLLHQKITRLLRSIEATNSATDREQLVEMIRLIKGTSDRNWDELVDSLQSENAILDFDRLRTELVEGGDDEVAAATAAAAGKKDASPTIPAMAASASAHQPVPPFSADETDLHTVNRVSHHHQQQEDEEEIDEEEEDEQDEEEKHVGEKVKEEAKEYRHGHGGSVKQSDGLLAKESLPTGATGGRDGGDHQRLMKHQYSALRGLHRPPATGEALEPQTTGSDDNGQHHHHHHQHVVGERIDAHHHLGWGPHGALVIRANEEDLEEHRSIQNGHEIQEKINIHAHELKPNHAGLVVSYDHRSTRRDGTGTSHEPKRDDLAHSSHVKHGGLGQVEQKQDHHHHHHHPNHNHPNLHQHHHHSPRHGQRAESEHRPEPASESGHHQKAHGQEQFQQHHHTPHHGTHPGSQRPASGGVASGENQ
uniref:Putative secreted protein n=1 Tax=Anopheles marajoara TaxID=58244 RepID=A0A2M4BFY5_9DIPT